MKGPDPKDVLIRALLRFIAQCARSHYARIGCRRSLPRFKARAVKLGVRLPNI